MDAVAKRMLNANWNYPRQDDAALAELERRIGDAGRQERLITYSDLVRGIQFRLRSVQNGKPFSIDVHNWSSLDRAIIGEFLGYISTFSYSRHEFMASALSVSSQTLMPSELFYDWMYEIGALRNDNEFTRMEFWKEQLDKSYVFYRHHTSVL